MTSPTLADLIARCEAGERTRQLECDIWEFVTPGSHRMPEVPSSYAPRYFSSLDAARSLVPKGCAVMSGCSWGTGFFCEIAPMEDAATSAVAASTKAETECAAIVLAALRARAG